MMSTTESDDDSSSVSSWSSAASSSSSSSNSSRNSNNNNSSSSQRSVSSSSSSASTAAPPGKYKRRRRVYERIKAAQRYQPLATVPEGEELRDHHSWFGPKVAGLLIVLIICIAGIKEGVFVLQTLVACGDGGRYYGEDADQLRRRKKNKKPLSTVSKVPQEEEDDEEDDEADFKLMRKVKIPDELKYLASIYDPILSTDRAFLWHVPRSAAATIKSIASQCFGLLLATEMGAATASDQISIITDLEGGNYVNVDTSTPAGIQHAKELNMANLAGLNFVSTSYFYDAAEHLFSEYHRGRCMTMMRHPVDRAASLFHLFASDPNNQFAGMTIDEYVNSDRVERNWMTRFLSNGVDNELKLEHLAIAKRVLEQKCLVGMMKFKWESLRRFETYFGWTLDGEKVNDCHTKLLDWNWPNKNKHPAVKEGSEAWRKLAALNDLDMKLYKHAEKIYKIQGQRLFAN